MTKKIIAAAVFAAVAGSASAQTVTMKFLGTGEGRNVKISFDGDTSNVFVGELRHRISATDMGPEFMGDFTTFCVDLSQVVSSSNNTYHANALPATPQAANKSLETARRMAAALDAHLPGNQNNSTAVQLVLWELLYDFNPQVGIASLDLTSGRFSAKRTNGSALWNDVASIANGLLNIATGDLSADAFGKYTVLASPSKQDQVVPVPSAGPLALAATGGLLLVGRRRRQA